VNELIEAARQHTGLDDFGDEHFRPSLDSLVYSLNEEAQLSEGGRIAAEERVMRLLVNRLRSQADLKRHPEILEQDLKTPVVILGLPRVGSTKLHRMLAAGGAFQDPLMWQVYNPAPFPDAKPGEPDPRIDAARKYLEWRSSVSPGTGAAHPMGALEVEEEIFLLEFSFDCIYSLGFFEAPTLRARLDRRDPRYMYEYLGRMLKYLQWQFHREDPQPWILKTPPNLGYEQQISAVMPGTRYVMSHRDPVSVLASLAALIRHSRWMYSGEADTRKIGEWCLDEWSRAMQRHMAWRDAHPEIQILDVAYRDVEKNGMQIAERVYEFLGVPMTADARSSIAGWMDDNTQHKQGKHRYSIADAGVPEQRIREAFAEYTERFAPYL
jgi:hypothetical protein